MFSAWTWPSTIPITTFLRSMGCLSLLYFELIVYLCHACDFARRSFDAAALLLTLDRAAQGHLAALCDDLHVLGGERERAIGHHGLANLLRDLQIGRTVALIERGQGRAVPIALVDLGVVR